jgi:hypothetical protein
MDKTRPLCFLHPTYFIDVQLGTTTRHTDLDHLNIQQQTDILGPTKHQVSDKGRVLAWAFFSSGRRHHQRLQDQDESAVGGGGSGTGAGSGLALGFGLAFGLVGAGSGLALGLGMAFGLGFASGCTLSLGFGWGGSCSSGGGTKALGSCTCSVGGAKASVTLPHAAITSRSVHLSPLVEQSVLRFCKSASYSMATRSQLGSMSVLFGS